MMPNSSADERDDRQHRTDRIEAALVRVASSVGTKKWPSTIAAMQTGTLTRKTDPQPKCSTSRPPPSGPIAMPSPGDAGPDADGPGPLADPWKVLVRIDSVVGKMNAPPMPMSARGRDEHLRRPRQRRQRREHAEQHEAERQRALAPEAVAQRPGGEQQAGEHDGVRSR